jgi:hypothetical protein
MTEAQFVEAAKGHVTLYIEDLDGLISPAGAKIGTTIVGAIDHFFETARATPDFRCSCVLACGVDFHIDVSPCPHVFAIAVPFASEGRAMTAPICAACAALPDLRSHVVRVLGEIGLRVVE